MGDPHRSIAALTARIARAEQARAIRRQLFLDAYAAGYPIQGMAVAAGLTADAVRKQMWPPTGVRPKH